MSLDSIPKEYLKELEEVKKTERFQEIKAIVSKLNSELATMAVFSSEDKALQQNSVHSLCFELEFTVLVTRYTRRNSLTT